MFFIVKQISGKKYLYKVTSYRKNGLPKHKQEYIGSVESIKKAILKESD